MPYFKKGLITGNIKLQSINDYNIVKKKDFCILIFFSVTFILFHIDFQSLMQQILIVLFQYLDYVSDFVGKSDSFHEMIELIFTHNF